jgi:hypothetical protein
MSDIVYVSRADGSGEDPIDLHMCRRFWLRDPGRDESPDDLLIYYLTRGGRWVQVFQVQDEDGWSYVHREAHPVEVAHDMLRYWKKLPPELEEHRDLAADWTRYYAWQEERRVKPGGITRPPGPRWFPEANTLYVDGIPYLKYKNGARRQTELLDAFEREQWRESIACPRGLRGNGKLSETTKAINKKISDVASRNGKTRPLFFRGDSSGVTWRRQRLPAAPRGDLP